MQGGKVSYNINFVSKSTFYISTNNPFTKRVFYFAAKANYFIFKEKCYE